MQHPAQSNACRALARRLSGIMILAAALLLTGCDNDVNYHHPNFPNITGPNTVVGSGSVASETRAVQGFHGVSLSGAGRLLIDRNGFESLTLTADDNILPLLTSDVLGGMLELGIETGRSISTRHGVTYEVGANRLDEIRLAGAGDVEATGLDTPFFLLDVAGAGNVVAFGRADEQDVTISGAGNYDAEGLTSRVATITISGAAFARVRVSGQLNAHIGGAGVLEYYGDPVVHTTGNGTVRRMGP
ncbi:MAG: DUF2807 domain-containing protein [bacterium]|nr:DUF2807 domain-containing protein [bacterium]